SAFVGIILLLLGALTATPLVATLLGRLLQPAFTLAFGLAGRLAADNLVRSPGRTVLVIAALAATGALLMQTSGFILISETAIVTWLDEQVGADLFVTSGSPISGGVFLGTNERLRDLLREHPEVEQVMGTRYYRLDYGKDMVFLVAMDTDTFQD